MRCHLGGWLTGKNFNLFRKFRSERGRGSEIVNFS